MHPRLALRAMVFVSLIVMAGCSGAGEPLATDSAPEDANVSAPGDDLENPATITGLVVNDEGLPVAGARGSILELEIEARTGEDGEFSFTNLEPGTYTVAVLALGYESASKKVTVVAGEKVEVSFVVEAIPIAEPWIDVLGPFGGYFDYRVGTPVLTGGASPNDKSSWTYEMWEDTDAFVHELEWEQASAGTSTSLRLSFSYQGRGSTHWFCSNTGPSLLASVYLMDGGCQTSRGDASQVPSGTPTEPSTDNTLLSYVNTPFGGTSTEDPPLYLTVAQRFDIIVSMFQHEEPPEGYSAFPDS